MPLTAVRMLSALCAACLLSTPTMAASSKAACSGQPVALTDGGPVWNGWGAGLDNSRYQTEAAAGLTAESVPRLKLKWAFGFPGDLSAYSQPVVFGGRLFVGSAGGTLYALDAKTGCTYWSYETLSGIRAAVIVAPMEGVGYVAYAADQQANVYALDASTGRLIWTVRADPHAQARITGAPQFHLGTLYVPVASGEEWASADPHYPCCTFRGSVTALDARTGKQLWKTYTIADPPKATQKNRAGTQLWGPSGASIWGAPTIDAKRNTLYAATGSSTSEPGAPTADSVVAMDLGTGKMLWSRQLSDSALFALGCVQSNRASCPNSPGPDHDFASSPILRELTRKKRILIAGQKSGLVHALDPDDEGEIVWQEKIGKGGLLGGIEWGAAADEKNVYAPLSDLALENSDESTGFRPSFGLGGGLFALRLRDGRKVWSAPAFRVCKERGCSPAQTAAAAVIPGVVFSGALDGHLRAYSTADGSLLWDYATAREYPETVNGVPARGGGIDGASATIAGGMVYVNSGFGQLHGMPGNVLLAFGSE